MLHGAILQKNPGAGRAVELLLVTLVAIDLCERLHEGLSIPWQVIRKAFAGILFCQHLGCRQSSQTILVGSCHWQLGIDGLSDLQGHAAHGSRHSTKSTQAGH